MPVPRCRRVSRAAWPLAGSAWNFKVELQLRQAPARPRAAGPPLPVAQLVDRDSAAPLPLAVAGNLKPGPTVGLVLAAGVDQLGSPNFEVRLLKGH